MPVARSPADVLCLAVYALAGGRVLRGFMVATIADRLGIPFERAEEMAIAAAEAGLVRHEMHTVRLTAAGFDRGARLTTAFVKPAGSGQPGTRPAPRAKRRARSR